MISALNMIAKFDVNKVSYLIIALALSDTPALGIILSTSATWPLPAYLLPRATVSVCVMSFVIHLCKRVHRWSVNDLLTTLDLGVTKGNPLGPILTNWRNHNNHRISGDYTTLCVKAGSSKVLLWPAYCTLELVSASENWVIIGLDIGFWKPKVVMMPTLSSLAAP